MTPRFLMTAALLVAALPASAQSPAKPLTPPDVLGKAKTIQVTVTAVLGGVPQEVSNAKLVQPNKAYIVDTDAKTKAVKVVYASDGKTQTEYQTVSGRYTQSEATSSLADMDSHTLASFALNDFLSPSAFAKFGHGKSEAPNVYRRVVARQEGKRIEEVLTVSKATALPLSAAIFISPSKTPKRPAEQINFTGWKLNAPINDSQFAYTPPAGAKLYVTPKLLADGTAAPDFTVQDKDGKPIKLSDYRGKTIVLDFWATWCGPCQSSLPHTTAVAKKYADKNVVVLAVNVWDTSKAFQDWLPKHPEYAPLNFAVDTSTDQSKSVATALYGVSGIPTQYVIDPSGKIIKSIVGYEDGDTQLEDALKVQWRQ